MQRRGDAKRDDVQSLLRRHPQMHDTIYANVPAAARLKQEQVKTWLRGLGLNPANHGFK